MDVSAFGVTAPTGSGGGISSLSLNYAGYILVQPQRRSSAIFGPVRGTMYFTRSDSGSQHDDGSGFLESDVIPGVRPIAARILLSIGFSARGRFGA